MATGASGGLLQHWDGSTWSPKAGSRPVVNAYVGLGGTGSNDVWAVGYQNSGLGVLAHWDGSAWTDVPAPPNTHALNSVWASSPSDAWAVGNNGTILHLTGSAWAVVDSGTTDTLLHVSGVDASHVFISGAKGLLMRWNGTCWFSTRAGTLSWYSVWAVSTHEAWAFGGNGGGGLAAHHP
jgi:photosystem II stability/assembly factor-like uncharacterized protein